MALAMSTTCQSKYQSREDRFLFLGMVVPQGGRLRCSEPQSYTKTPYSSHLAENSLGCLGGKKGPAHYQASPLKSWALLLSRKTSWRRWSCRLTIHSPIRSFSKYFLGKHHQPAKPCASTCTVDTAPPLMELMVQWQRQTIKK